MTTSGPFPSPCVVISQPMYFPWVGFLQQIRLADVFVFYDDVQFTSGGFLNRVQVKTEGGIRWMTVPLRDQHLGQRINEVTIDDRSPWRQRHRELLKRAYDAAPHREEMLRLVDAVFAQSLTSLAELSQASTFALVDYFGLSAGTSFLVSSSQDVPGRSTQRVIDLCAHVHGKTYLTGHGARNYLVHEEFEARGLSVAYIDYGVEPYPQAHGTFTPYVTALDLVAHCGRAGVNHITGTMQEWRSFLAARATSQQEKS